MFISSSNKNYLENDDFLKEQKSCSCYCVTEILLNLHKQLCLDYHSKHLQSAGNIREETDKAINFEAFAKCDEQIIGKMPLVSWNADFLASLSTLKEHYWSVIIKTLFLNLFTQVMEVCSSALFTTSQT